MVPCIKLEPETSFAKVKVVDMRATVKSLQARLARVRLAQRQRIDQLERLKDHYQNRANAKSDDSSNQDAEASFELETASTHHEGEDGDTDVSKGWISTSFPS